MTVSEKVSRRNRHQGRSPLEGLRGAITTTEKIRNTISTLSLLFVAAENGAVDVCRYLLARSRFSSFFHKNFIITWSWYSPIILKRISVCHPGLVSRLTSPPTTGSAHFLRPRSEHSVFFSLFTAAQWNLWQLHTFRIQIVISWIALSNVSQRLLPKWWNLSVFYRTRVRSLAMLVSNSLTDWLTDSCLVDLIDVTLACEDIEFMQPLLANAELNCWIFPS